MILHKFPMKFKNLFPNSTFTPVQGAIGAGKTYVKRVNGICPCIGAKEEGIFWPDDLVIPVKPEKRV